MKIKCDYDFKIYNNDVFIGLVHSYEERMITKKVLNKKLSFVFNKVVYTIKAEEMK